MVTPTSSSAASPTSSNTDIRAPLWDHVTILEKAPSGGNTKWKCNYCEFNGFSSYTYTGVEAHLLQIKNKGIGICTKMTFELLSQLRGDVQRCKDLVQRSKQKNVPLPTAPAPSDDGKKKKRGPASALEKYWVMQYHKHLDALIARAFYSGGVPFNFARNPYLREAFNFAANCSMPGYQMPGYNKFREGMLAQEMLIIAEGQVKTKEYIAEKLKSIIEEVGRQNVVQIITDNAANCNGVPDDEGANELICGRLLAADPERLRQ
ncbi:hypothetical protein PR202_ga29903 [Eleusine coracana subsp. coracana]|uniref:DUF659 domain-containing protein n=1 Tax=Eleusine coracana subsp. coracana TaxID=191504 RepID=A0AAV5DN40_ELECO|nr:hypothetical protein PR202_ga29903 [Eleusine coracana subsp. coracana]